MFATISGLPAHPLVVHAAVVTVLAALASGVQAAWRGVGTPSARVLVPHRQTRE